MKTNGKLSEASVRYLLRIAALMKSGETGEVVVTLRQGGVIGYRESRSFQATDLEESDEVVARELGLA